MCLCALPEKAVFEMNYAVSGGRLNPTHSVGIFSVSQRPNLRHLSEPLGRAVGLLEAVSFMDATESVCRGRTADARSERVPDCGGCNAKTAGGKSDVDMWN